MSEIDKEMENCSGKLNNFGNSRYCLDGYLKPSFDVSLAEKELSGN